MRDASKCYSFFFDNPGEFFTYAVIGENSLMSLMMGEERYSQWPHE